jgi:uncharacterized protein
MFPDVGDRESLRGRARVWKVGARERHSMTTPEMPGNGDSREYWRGAHHKQLMLQKCHVCGAVQFPPRHHCATCWDSEPGWFEASGRGIVESVTVVRRAPIAAFRSKVPYVVAAIRIAEGPRMITNLIGEGALLAQIGDAVVVDFAAAEGGVVLPQFRLTSKRA